MVNPQAQELNDAINRDCPPVFSLLSDKGREIFFPKEGILAQTAEAKGKRINATIGIAVEDDGSPMRLRSIEHNVNLNPREVFTYAPSYGKPELRKAWLEQIRQKNPSLKGAMSLPIVTNGITHGLSIVGYLFANPGDEIIITDKFWGNYKLIFCSAYGAKLNQFTTFDKDGFNLEAFREKMLPEGKKIVALNFPNNPTGYTPTEEEAEAIVRIIKDSAERGNNICVICDDAYFGLVYKDGIYKESLFSRLADLHENVLAVKLDGATKEDYVWGFRVGFITHAIKGITDSVCIALEAKTAGAIRGNISNVSHLSQSLVLRAFESETYRKEKEEKYALLKSRFSKVEEVLKDSRFLQYFEALPFNSGYFMCIRLKGLDAEKVRRLLLAKYDTGVISVGDMLRIAFSSVSEKDIPELFENIYKACKDSAQ